MVRTVFLRAAEGPAKERRVYFCSSAKIASKIGAMANAITPIRNHKSFLITRT